jgi:type I restriction enzyme, S subunit
MGWQTFKVKDVCSVEKEKLGKDKLPYVGMEDIESGTGRFLGDPLPKSVASSTFKFSDKHVLYGRLRPYLNKVLVPNFEGHCSSEIFPLKPVHNLDRSFLAYWLRSERVVSAINRTCTGARMPRANVKELLEFDIDIPSTDEQKRIVAILDEAFADIDKARALTELNLENARELFESYLQKVIFQHDNKLKLESMDSVCDLITCGVAATPKYVDKHIGVPFLSAQNVKNGEVILDNFKFIPKELHLSLTKKNKPKKGDILYSRVGAGFGEAAVVEHNFDFSVYVSLTLIKPNMRKLDKYFLRYYLNSPKIKQLARSSITSSGVPNLNVKTVRGFPVYYPSLTDQKNIVKKLDQLNVKTLRLIDTYSSKLAAIDEFKKSLLQKAFTGELTKAG